MHPKTVIKKLYPDAYVEKLEEGEYRAKIMSGTFCEDTGVIEDHQLGIGISSLDAWQAALDGEFVELNQSKQIR